MKWQLILLRLKDALTLSQLLTTLNVLLFVGVTWTAGNLLARIVENELLQVPYNKARFVPPKIDMRDQPRSFSEFNAILEQNVFNAEVFQEKQPAAEQTVQAAPGAILRDLLTDLQLLGIQYRKDYYIFSIIKSKKKNMEDIFTIGDPIFDTGLVVQRIFTTWGNQKVQVQLGNEIGFLEYIDDTLPKEQPGPVPPKMPVSNLKPAPPVSTSSVYTKDGNTFHISASEVDAQLDDFATLLNQARMVPYFKDNKHQGFRVKAIDQGSLYQKLGLQNNDILKAVNGESLAEAGGEKLMGLFKLLRNEREFTVEIERNGTSQVLNYYVN